MPFAPQHIGDRTVNSETQDSDADHFHRGIQVENYRREQTRLLSPGPPERAMNHREYHEAWKAPGRGPGIAVYSKKHARALYMPGLRKNPYRRYSEVTKPLDRSVK